jgi:F-type H+-transporting ATPase subunit alpha
MGTNGYLDEIPLDDVQRFERELHQLIDLKYQDLLSTLAMEKDLSKETVDKLHMIAKDFVGKFKATAK